MANLEDVKLVVKDILMNEKNGMEKAKFPSQYKALKGSTFPFRELGFESPYELLKFMPKFRW